jgi:hypothetical protein
LRSYSSAPQLRETPSECRDYYDLICWALPAAARRALEEAMIRVDPKLDTPMVRKVLAIGRAEGRTEGRLEGRTEGRLEGEARGRLEGEARGRAVGEARGRAEGMRAALLTLLRERRIELGARTRARVQTCEDLAALDLWIRRAVAATCARDVFDPTPARRSRRPVDTGEVRGRRRMAVGASRSASR